ncbi:MAG: MarR family transcriptional regulator [Spirochaetia bacterium]|jgi:DNA-binding MarR family transcriptional regulator
MDKLKTVDYIMHRKLWQKLNLKEKPASVMILARLLVTARDNPGGIRVSDLAGSFNVTASGVTQLVTGLEERGYVARTMDPDDRRGVLVHLTEPGAREAEAIMTTVDAVFSGLVDHLGHEKSRQLLDLLTDVTRYFEGLDARSRTESEQR